MHVVYIPLVNPERTTTSDCECMNGTTTANCNCKNDYVLTLNVSIR